MCDLNETKLENNHLVAHSTCSFTLALIGTVGNVASIVLICYTRLCQNVTMILLSNLCLTDLILSGVILPLLGINGFHAGWLYGEAFCQIFAYVLYVTLSSEFILLMLITLNQYLIVVRNMKHPNWRPLGKRVKLIMVLLSPWFLGAVIYLLPLTKAWGQFGFDPRIQMCTLLNLKGAMGMKAAFSLTMLFISITVILYCYTAIFCVHYRSRRKTAPSTNGSSSATHHAISSRNSQLIRMISVILINFGVTYIPFFVMYATDACLENTPPSAVVAIVYISFSHSSTNPIIYALMNKQILNQWKKVLTRCLNPSKRPQRERSGIFLLNEREMELRPGLEIQPRTNKEGSSDS